MPVDVQALGADFIVASSHKMCGPTGIGFLWGRWVDAGLRAAKQAASAHLIDMAWVAHRECKCGLSQSLSAPPPPAVPAGMSC